MCIFIAFLTLERAFGFKLSRSGTVGLGLRFFTKGRSHTAGAFESQRPNFTLNDDPSQIL